MNGQQFAPAADEPVFFAQHAARPCRRVLEPAYHEWVFPDGSRWVSFHRQRDGYFLRFPGLGDFAVSRDGRRVDSWPLPGVSTATVHHLYLNQVLPLALSRQGKLVLHASAVEMGDGCVAFMGQSGRGKSTLAASFAMSGWRVLTDDGLQLDWRDQALTALPSHPSIRLWEDSQQALIGTGAAVAPAVGYTSKVRLLAGAAFEHCDEPRPVNSIYLLGDGTSPTLAIQDAKPSCAMIELVRHSFLLDIDAEELLSSHFDEIARVANATPHYHLDFPRRYESLPAVRGSIVRLAGGGSGAIRP